MMQTETRLSECLDSERCGSMQCFRISKINPDIIFTLLAEGEKGGSGTSIAVSCLESGRTSLINFELGRDIIYPSFLALSVDEKFAYIRFSNVLERGFRLIWGIYGEYLLVEDRLSTVELSTGQVKSILQSPAVKYLDYNPNYITDVQEKDNLILINLNDSFLVLDKTSKQTIKTLDCKGESVIRSAMYPDQTMLVKGNKFYFPSPDLLGIQVLDIPDFNTIKTIELPLFPDDPDYDGQCLDCFVFSKDQSLLLFELQKHIGIIDTNKDQLLTMIPIAALDDGKGDSLGFPKHGPFHLLISDDNKRVFAITSQSIFMADLHL